MQISKDFNFQEYKKRRKKFRLFGKRKPLHPAVIAYLARKNFLRITIYRFEILIRRNIV